MKTWAVLAGVILLSLVSVTGAQREHPPLGKGLKGGVGIADAAYHAKPTDIKTTYLIGALLSYQQNDWFSFQVEGLYTAKGYTVRNVEFSFQDTLGENIGVTDAEIILGYLEIPILGKFTVPVRGKFRPYAIGGGFMALSVISKSRLIGGRTAIDADLDNAENVDLGTVVAVGIDIKLGGGWMFVESRFDSSFRAAIKNQKHKNQALFFQFGYWW